MKEIKTAIMTVENPNLDDKWYEIKFTNRAELLEQVFNLVFDDYGLGKLGPLPDYVNISFYNDQIPKTYKCSITLLHYCYAKGRITDKKLVSMTFSRKNRIR